MNRRNFLKALGVGSGTSALSACGVVDHNMYYTPVEQILPYVVRPEHSTPGTNTYFATTLLTGPAASPVLAVHRDGRVTMVDGNQQGPSASGVTSANYFELQRHYSPDRVTEPRMGNPVTGTPSDWNAGLAKLVEAVRETKAAGKKVAWIGPYRSGSIVPLIQRMAGEDAIFWEPAGRESEAAASEALFGTRVLPHYAIERAHYVLSFGAELLGGWGGAASESAYAEARDPSNGHVARMAMVSSRRGITGANADDWYDARPGSEAAVALAVAKLVAEATHYKGPAHAMIRGANVAGAAAASGLSEEQIKTIAEHFASGPAVAIPGGGFHADRELAAAVYLLNMVGHGDDSLFTLDGYQAPVHGLEHLKSLAADMNAGKIGLLLLDDGTDPVHATPSDLGLADAIQKVDMVVSLSSHGSETAALAHMVLPISDTLEDWGDEQPRKGMWLLRQPAQTPLYDTRSLGDVLLSVFRATEGASAPQNNWHAHLMSVWQSTHWPHQAFWDEIGGHDGDVTDSRLQAWLASVGEPQTDALAVTEDEAQGDPVDPSGAAVAVSHAFHQWWSERLSDGYFLSPWSRAKTNPSKLQGGFNFSGGAPAGEGLTLVAFAHPFLGTGRYANQPWAQETPEPMTGHTWDTWVEVHPDTAARLGLDDNVLAEIQTEAGSLAIGVEVTRMVSPNTLAVPMGGGHTAASGRYADGVGQNVMRLLSLGSTTTAIQQVVAKGQADLVSTFGADHDSDRNFAVNVNADAFAKVGDAPKDHPGELTGIHHLKMDRRLTSYVDPNTNEPAPIEGFYPAPDHPNYRFGMAIDTDACTGCGACAVACYAENNLPVVGKQKVKEGREMGWIRINRYFKEDGDGHTSVNFVPMMCQQCGHAPCESVCPVLATYHNLDGLNAMVYNRCVGTRYCSNACPYTVRKFNYHSYVWPQPFNLQLNPDVATRTMGVMEKCTFCVQRIRKAKSAYRDRGIEADGSFTHLVPDEALQQLPACASACPTQAMTFGNLEDPEAAVSKKSKSARSYIPLAELNTFPAITYLAKASFHTAKPGGHGGHGGHGDHDASHGHEPSHGDASAHADPHH